MKPNRIFILLAVVSLFVIAVGVPSMVAHAAPNVQEAPPIQSVDFGSLTDTLKNLAGVGALIAALVNIGKSTGIVKDGQAGNWSAGLNTVALIGLVVAQMTGYGNLIPSIDAQAGTVATVIGVVFAFAFQIYLSRVVHNNVFAGLPVIGKSNSDRKAGENMSIIEVG